jgi:hypothetical protein
MTNPYQSRRIEYAVRNIHAGFGAKMPQKAHGYCVERLKFIANPLQSAGTLMAGIND